MNNDHTNPRPVSTGVTDELIGTPTPALHDAAQAAQAGVDWLQYSVAWPANFDRFPDHPYEWLIWLEEALPPSDEIFLTGEILKPLPGYNHGAGATHARLFWHSHRREQMIGVIMTGNDLQSQLSIPFPQDALLRWVNARSKKVARMDVCIDVREDSANFHDIMNAWDDNRITTPARQAREMIDDKRGPNGDTIRGGGVYLGSRESDRQLRVYDKRAETNTDQPWTRIELQLRDDRAGALLKDCIQHGIGITIQAAVRSFATIRGIAWWDRATQGHTVELSPVPREERKTKEWLLNIVMPSLIKEIMLERESTDKRITEMIQAVVRDFTDTGHEEENETDTEE